MAQDANKIMDNLSNQWAAQSVNDKKLIAVLQEENDRLKAELDELKGTAENVVEAHEREQKTKQKMDKKVANAK